MLKKIIWIIISLIAAIALSVVVGIFNPSEKINALWLIVAAGCFYVITYRFYASFLAAKVLASEAVYTSLWERQGGCRAISLQVYL